jgi:hypothetical protein
VTQAQWIFTIALLCIAVLITAFAVFVARTTFWADRWYRRHG